MYIHSIYEAAFLFRYDHDSKRLMSKGERWVSDDVEPPFRPLRLAGGPGGARSAGFIMIAATSMYN